MSTTFSEIQDPIVEPRDTEITPPRPVAKRREATPANLLNLLIVDNERTTQDGCREAGYVLGFTTHVVDTAEQALRTFETVSIDVVLLDLKSPSRGGLEFLREVKKRHPETVVVVITGASLQSAVRAMKNGAYDYLTKPFSLDELRLLLERVIERVQLVSENRILRHQVKLKTTIQASDLSSSVQNCQLQDQTISAPAQADDFITPLLSVEKEAILKAIEQSHGNKLKAARLLGIGKTTMYRKLREYGAKF